MTLPTVEGILGGRGAKVVETICLCGGSVTVKAAETGVV